MTDGAYDEDQEDQRTFLVFAHNYRIAKAVIRLLKARGRRAVYVSTERDLRGCDAQNTVLVFGPGHDETEAWKRWLGEYVLYLHHFDVPILYVTEEDMM